MSKTSGIEIEANQVSRRIVFVCEWLVCLWVKSSHAYVVVISETIKEMEIGRRNLPVQLAQ